MKHLLATITLVLSTGLLVGSPALAAKKAQMQNIDFGEITCGEFLKEISGSSAEDAGVVLMWIDGYLSGVSGDTELDWKNLETFSTQLVNYCGQHADTKVLKAAEAVGISN